MYVTLRRASRLGIVALLVAALNLPTLLDPAPAAAGVKPVLRESYVEAGGWRTVVKLWNASARGAFRGPAGAKIRVRYGAGWFAVNRQKQMLDGFNEKHLDVGRGSIFYARMQVKVPYDTWVTWIYVPT
jgi:hypothetical protein